MSTSTSTAREGGQGLLQRALLADGVISGATGLALIAAAQPLSDVLGLSVMFLRVVGLILLPFAAMVLYVATRSTVGRRGTWCVVALNLVWAVDSVLLLMSGWVDPATVGSVFIVGQALMVAAFAEMQIIGLRRSG